MGKDSFKEHKNELSTGPCADQGVGPRMEPRADQGVGPRAEPRADQGIVQSMGPRADQGVVQSIGTCADQGVGPRMEPRLYAMLLTPAFKDYIWGGERLIKEYGKITEMHPVAESWELSCHPDGFSVVKSGEYEGRTLAGLLEEYPGWIGPSYRRGDGAAAETEICAVNVGAGATDAEAGAGAAEAATSMGAVCAVFPILIKLIDAKQDLSLQVHPGDEYARKHENSLGKNEAWYVVDCEPGATMILGLKKNVPADKLAHLLKEGNILDYANIVPVKPGDCFRVPAGLLHAIGGGVLVAEVQQSSNITYRVYDYGRVDAGGKPRPLHIERAAEVIDSSLSAVNCSGGAVRQFGGYRITELIDWSFFKLSKLDVDGEASLECPRTGSFHTLLVLDGDFSIIGGGDSESGEKCERGKDSERVGQGRSGVQGGTDATRKYAIEAVKGSCVFVPSGLGRYVLRGRGCVLFTTI